MNVAVGTADGVFTVDIASEDVIAFDAGTSVPPPAPLDVTLPRVVATAAAGSTIVALVDRRPPLAVSHDGGITWREAGGGLPAGRAIAVSADDPDTVVFAARNRIHVSHDGGRFWRALAPELPEIRAVAFREA